MDLNMKLAFSTLGCPGWSFEDILSTAKDANFNGVEIRGIENELYAPKCRVFLPDNIEKTILKLKSLNLEIPMLASGACLGVREGIKSAETEAKDYIDLAQKLGTRYVRVMVTGNTFVEAADLELLIKEYTDLCDYAKDKGVIPLLETNGVLADTTVMADVMDRTNRENSGVLWDIHHPYRYFNESPNQSIKNLGSRIKYIHVKDSVVQNGEISYRMMGYGNMPIFDAVKALKDNGYDGYISLEWVKRWCPDLQEPGIVFSHYINFMEYLFTQL